MFHRTALSVVVATFDRPNQLASCLASLSPEVQTIIDPYEVIVVDQSPLSRHSNRISSSFPFIKYHTVDWRGLARARNYGTERAESPIIAFLDDDAVAEPDWVETMLNAFEAPGNEWVRMCGGRVSADYGDLQRPAWLSAHLERYLSCVDFGKTSGPLQKGLWIVGANFAIRRADLIALGGFDERLGRRGCGDLLSNEESVLVERIGLKNVCYDHTVHVHHRVSAERLQQSWFRRRVCWQAVSDVISGAQYLEDRQIGRVAEKDALLLGAIGPLLFSDVESAEALEGQLLTLYDLVSCGLLPAPPSDV